MMRTVNFDAAPGRQRRRLAGVGLVLLLAGSPVRMALAQEAAPRPPCQPWQACEAEALDALTRGDYETCHDLAWRAVQKGPPRNVELMFLLARAQVLSGRPHDALVMLRRITELGAVPRAALSSAEFERTRALSEWPEVEALIVRLDVAGGPSATTEAPTATAPASPRVVEPARAVTPVAPASAAAPTPAETAASTPAAPMPVVPRTPAEEVLRFASRGLVPSGLAFDGVSGRFLFADAPGRKVVIVQEQSSKLVDLVRAESAGFHEVLALEIDTRRGDLWVASAEAGGPSTDGSSGHSAIHKLQLVSGRPLATISAPDDDRVARFTDLAVTAAGAVIALDAPGRRLWRLPPGGRTLAILGELPLEAPASLALAEDGQHVFVAHAGGLARVDLATGRARPVTAAEGVVLTGLARVRTHGGALVAIQGGADGSHRVVRVRLDRAGLRATGVEALVDALPAGEGVTAVTVSGDDLYYVAPVAANGHDGGQAELVVSRLRLR